MLRDCEEKYWSLLEKKYNYKSFEDFSIYATDMENKSALDNTWYKKISTKLQNIEQTIAGITTSFSYLGSFPSTFGLHVEDLNFWSVNVHCRTNIKCVTSIIDTNSVFTLPN